ncbi:hypothetical protein [Azospira restricta]|uniref:Uncharacterized protein n=1 Tax=Azospira restricta TaxID=404405 RepID=A0A974PXI1_9RHOO|nr:hypothetical protein [Azospira restricta]QRJ63267.1 hypothetical protein IWH25_16190 [Azospira restricta]
MKIPSLSNLIRLALLRGLMRLGGFILRRAAASTMRPARAHAQRAAHAAPGRVIDGEFRRVDPRHHNSW